MDTEELFLPLIMFHELETPIQFFELNPWVFLSQQILYLDNTHQYYKLYLIYKV